MVEVLLSEGFLDSLLLVCKALYQMYCLLRLADMMIGGNITVKYYKHQIDLQLPQSVAELLEKWKSDSCPVLKLKLSCGKELTLIIPRLWED